MLLYFSQPCIIRSVKSKNHNSDHSTIGGAISNTGSITSPLGYIYLY